MDASLKASADALLAAGRWREARPLLESLAQSPGCDAAVVRQLADIDILSGEPALAMQRLERLGDDDEAEFLRARAELALGRAAQARDRLLALRSRLAVPSAMLEVQLSAAYRELGQMNAAVDALQAAVRLDPRPEGTRHALAVALLHLAIEQTRQGDAQSALASLDAAAAAGPRDATTWANIGYLFAEHLQYEPADRALARAAAFAPGDPEIETIRAAVKQDLGDNTGALQALAVAQARNPGDPRVAITQRLYLPQSYESVDDIARWRARYREGLAALERECDGWLGRADDVFRLVRTNFFLAYHGEDDRDLQRRYSALLARLAAAAAPQLRAPMPVTYRGQRRLRVGFFGNIFTQSTAGRYFERWVTRLDPARFERFVYHTAPSRDPLTERVAASAEHFFGERLDTRATAELIRSHGLDILVYPEVGMSTMTYVFAALRLAPVQCAAWGHPITTGSDAMDYFVTCADMEPPDGQAHYTERLVGLPGLGVQYERPPQEPAASKRELGLQDDAHVYVCAQSLFKVHPEMDALFARILAQDPRGVLVFFQSPARAVTEQLAARIQRAIAAAGIPPRRQVKFLPRMPGGPAFRRALGAADVMLDTSRWSGGNTSLDAFLAGVPVVTLEGRFMRGRQTSAMLGMLDLRRLVARDADDYVRLAIEVAGDRDLNMQTRKAIAGRLDALFDRPEPIAALQDALEEMARG